MYNEEQKQPLSDDYEDDEMSGSYISGTIDGSQDPENFGNGDHKSKTKRRSKNDSIGRDFRCGCTKRYLSYPALYTHIKQKHNGVTPIGTNTSQQFTGRGRGRPRKTTIS